MSVEQLLEEFGKLTTPEQAEFLSSVGAVPQGDNFEETPEFMAFVEEGIRSAEEGPMIPLEDALANFKAWRAEQK